uniref:Uncharacterized protein n=1 Tax=Hyaloperonospora arabidopsidis (strain Emoy2) TaxID=559515 RepID=M4BNX6_HYAAE
MAKFFKSAKRPRHTSTTGWPDGDKKHKQQMARSPVYKQLDIVRCMMSKVCRSAPKSTSQITWASKNNRRRWLIPPWDWHST